MIYDRHEDIAATTKRHPAIVRHRTGCRRRRPTRGPGHRGRDGRRRVLHADARSSCRAARSTPAGRTPARTSGSGPGPWPRTRRPNGAFRGFGAPQTEFAAEMQVNRIAEALGMSPLELRRRWRVPDGRHDADRPGPARERRRPRRSSSGPPRRPSSSGSGPERARDRAVREPGARTAPGPCRSRDRPRARLARGRLHRLGRGPPRHGRLASSSHRDGRDPRPDRLDRDGPGHEDDLPADRRRGARRPDRRGRASPRRTPRSCPTAARRSRRARRWSSAGC